MYVPRVRRFLFKRVYNAAITRPLFRNASAVIATSQLEAEEFKGSVSADKLKVRSNGVTLNSLRDLEGPSRLRAQWGVAKASQLIGYIGRISEKKRILELIDTFGTLSRSNTKLLIAGPVSEPGYLDRLKKSARSSPRHADIIFTGLLEGDQYVEALHALDLFVLPSANENFGNSAAEAVLSRVPVLLTHNCGVAPIIDGRVGLAVGQSGEALLQGLETMLKSETRNSWNPYWEKVQFELSWNEPVRVMENLYRSIIDKNTKGG